MKSFHSTCCLNVLSKLMRVKVGRYGLRGENCRKVWFIHCMVFSTLFNSISVISRQPVHLSLLSRVLLTSTPHNILSKTLASFLHDYCRNNGQWWERKESCRNDYRQSSERILASWGSNQRRHVLKSAMLLTDLWDSARLI